MFEGYTKIIAEWNNEGNKVSFTWKFEDILECINAINDTDYTIEDIMRFYTEHATLLVQTFDGKEYMFEETIPEATEHPTKIWAE